MPVCDQDHGGVSMPVADRFRAVSWSRSISFSVDIPWAEFRIRGSARNCPVYDGSGGTLPGRFCHANQPSVSKVPTIRTVIKLFGSLISVPSQGTI